MMEGFLIVILSIPLVDKSLQMDPYRVYNPPALNPELKVQFSHVPEENIWPFQHTVHILLYLHLMKFAYALHHEDTSVSLILIYTQWIK